jgi:surfactin synthase thioesterase subunit
MFPSVCAQAAVFAGLLDDNKPLSVLGHSSGSVLALEMCRALQKHYNYTAQHLFVCSLQAPHVRH